MEFELVNKENIEVSGLPVKITKSQKENFRIMTNQWKKFNKELRLVRTGNIKNWEKYGITYKKNGVYFYMPSVSSNSSFEKMIIIGGKYALFIHRGDIKFLKTTIYNIYKKIIPQNNLSLDPERIILHYEKYDYRFSWNRSDSIIEIYLPIENI